MSAEFYTVLHLAGIALVMVALGGTWQNAKAKVPAILHGVGTLVILVSGFGMVAKYGNDLGSSGWIHAKLGVWLVVGALLVVARKLPKLAALVYLGGPALVAVAAYLVIHKPF